jgi:hypothetical protein
MVPGDVAEFFDGHPVGLLVHDRVRALLTGVPGVETRVTRSQVAFRRRRGFAWLWLPGRYLGNPTAELVLSLALGRHEESARFKEVVHPSSRHWIHHLEVRAVEDVDDEVAAWLREAADRAGWPPPGRRSPSSASIGPRRPPGPAGTLVGTGDGS